MSFQSSHFQRAPSLSVITDIAYPIRSVYSLIMVQLEPGWSIYEHRPVNVTAARNHRSEILSSAVLFTQPGETGSESPNGWQTDCVQSFQKQSKLVFHG